MSTDAVKCRVLRCSRQDEMYIYLRDDLSLDDIPEALRKRAGRLDEVMQLELNAERKLARVDVVEVMRRLDSDGLFLQMPPDGRINAPLHFGD